MGSSGKRKTTMAKLARENRLRERRLNKEAKRDARRLESSGHLELQESPLEQLPFSPGTAPGALEPALEMPAAADREQAP